MRKIAIATGTRADWGLLSGPARALRERDDCQVTVLATNMHLSPRYGNTIDEIRADGFTDIVTVPMPAETDTPLDAVKAMAACQTAMAEALDTLRPDLIVILGDRFEMLATATAALMLRIPIVHIAGGEISEGAVDDSIRHAITKMASLHLTAAEPYRRRVIAMGEEPQRVINTGAIGVYNILHEPLLTRSELEESIGMELGDRAILVTYHPVTLDTPGVTPTMRATALLDALSEFPDSRVIITYPNNDPAGREIIPLIEEYGRRHPGRVRVIPSLGKRRYLSALRYVKVVAGNSSSGIVEVPSMGIPTVDVGIRQRGRLASDSVIHCADSKEAIAEALRYALSPEGQQRARQATNPYSQPDTLGLMVKAIAETPLETLSSKKFHDIV